MGPRVFPGAHLCPLRSPVGTARSPQPKIPKAAEPGRQHAGMHAGRLSCVWGVSVVSRLTVHVQVFNMRASYITYKQLIRLVSWNCSQVLRVLCDVARKARACILHFSQLRRGNPIDVFCGFRTFIPAGSADCLYRIFLGKAFPDLGETQRKCSLRSPLIREA